MRMSDQHLPTMSGLVIIKSELKTQESHNLMHAACMHGLPTKPSVTAVTALHRTNLEDVQAYQEIPHQPATLTS